jgi:hypothetical protein
MNRQFKFRICYTDQNGKKSLIYSDNERFLIGLNGKVYENYGKDWKNPMWEEAFDADELPIVQQYTGYTDSKGTQIYEGDILKNLTPHKYSSDIFIVEWTEFAPSDDMGVGGVGFVLPWFYCHFKPEVIGNIYEHKHLLEK